MHLLLPLGAGNTCRMLTLGKRTASVCSVVALLIRASREKELAACQQRVHL